MAHSQIAPSTAGRCARAGNWTAYREWTVSPGGHAADYELVQLGWHGRWPGAEFQVLSWRLWRDGFLASWGFACEPSVAYQSGTDGEAFEGAAARPQVPQHR